MATKKTKRSQVLLPTAREQALWRIGPGRPTQMTELDHEELLAALHDYQQQVQQRCWRAESQLTVRVRLRRELCDLLGLADTADSEADLQQGVEAVRQALAGQAGMLARLRQLHQDWQGAYAAEPFVRDLEAAFPEIRRKDPQA